MLASRLLLLCAATVGLALAADPPPEDEGEEIPEFCTMEYIPVCGTNGITYSSPCELRIAQKHFTPDLRVDFDGECCGDRMCLPEVLGTDALEHPVCASDGVTYTSACAFLSAQCLARQRLWPVPRSCCKADSDRTSLVCSLAPKGVIGQ